MVLSWVTPAPLPEAFSPGRRHGAQWEPAGLEQVLAAQNSNAQRVQHQKWGFAGVLVGEEGILLLPGPHSLRPLFLKTTGFS